MTIDIERLPRRELAAGQLLYRVHRAVHGAWYFSDDGSGRFDPVLTPDRGTCYLAEHPLGAWIEAFRTVMTLSEDDVNARVLSVVELPRPIEVVDLTSRRALAAGITAALTAGSDYTESQALASALVPAVPGVRWRVRHDLEQTMTGVALFGPAGPSKPNRWRQAVVICTRGSASRMRRSCMNAVPSSMVRSPTSHDGTTARASRGAKVHEKLGDRVLARARDADGGTDRVPLDQAAHERLPRWRDQATRGSRLRLLPVAGG